MHTTRYLINHGPSSSLNFGIPKEVWNDKEVTSHIYLFLIASLMFILVTILGTTWMLSHRNALSSGMRLMSSIIAYGMSITERSFGADILYLMKGYYIKTGTTKKTVEAPKRMEINPSTWSWKTFQIVVWLSIALARQVRQSQVQFPG